MLVTYTSPRLVGPSRPTHATYVRRRLLLLVLIAVVIGMCVAARSGLADGGSGPASAAPVGRSHVPGLLGDGTYVVQPGDSMWTIASRVTAGSDIAAYVDRLVASHGRATITAGERLRLP